MATGWAGDNAVNEQIDATVKDGIKRAQSRLPQGPSLTHCAECWTAIPAAPFTRLSIATTTTQRPVLASKRTPISQKLVRATA